MAALLATTRASRPPPVIIQPTSLHTHTFVLLHGLGNNGDRFGNELLETGLSSDGQTLNTIFPCARFVFPTAEWRRSAAFGRVRLTQWFNLSSLSDPSQRQEIQMDGFAESASYIRSIIAHEIETLPPGKIILGGLSQGCAMSLLILLSLEFSLGACIGMSGWLPYRHDIDDILGGVLDDIVSFGDEDESAPPDLSYQALGLIRGILSLDDINADAASAKRCLSTPLFLGHGERDEKVDCRLGDEAASTLSSLGMDVTWKRYPDLGHWYQIPGEIDDIVAFLNTTLK
ncbi:Alpha/Beta hydrolase protein [Massariosphaeria phaeospora]|uniref:Alpha/Beta hydrolase protein n=1 Tax=Massariosphaeria phaeospora TaxID=100035 RepID=A0A7C8I4E9_9PLEO|nr:Alpha/Beta hydrolase protein [Massariosphaeria phaeospora]